MVSRQPILVTYFCLQMTLIRAFPTTIPLGVLLDHWSSAATRTAIRYQVTQSSHSLPFNLSTHEFDIDSSDSLSVRRTVCSAMETGIFMFIGSTNSSAQSTIAAYTNTFAMPYVSVDEPAMEGPQFSVSLWPRYHHAIADIIRQYGWQEVFYVYDTIEGLVRLQNLLKIMRIQDKIDSAVHVIRIDELESSYLSLRYADKGSRSRERHIVLELSSVDALTTVLKHVHNIGMNRAGYNYILGGLSMDHLHLGRFIHGGVKITGFRFIDPHGREMRPMQREWSELDPKRWPGAGGNNKLQLQSALLMDAVGVAARAFQKLRRQNKDMFQHTFRRRQMYNRGEPGITCNRPISWEYGDAILHSLRSVEFEGVTGWIAFDQKTGARKDFTLDIMRLSFNQPLMKIGTWSSARGLDLADNKFSTKKARGSLRTNNTKIITTVITPPYMMLKTASENGTPLIGNDRYEGFCADLAKAVAKIVKFDYMIKEVRDKNYGARNDDGTWNGMIGELTNKEADLAVAPLTISAIRERVVDFSKPFMSLGISIMIKKPEKQKPGIFSFMNPLAFQIWMYIILAYLAVSVGLFLVSRFSPYEWQIEDSGVHGPTFTNDFTLLNSLWFALGAIMRQGCDISPRSMSGRIVGAAWWFFTLILISSYTANLVAFLTIERMLTPIESADDLSKQTEIQYGTLANGSTKEFFQTSQISVYSQMWNFMESAKPSVFVNSAIEGVERVRNSKGKYAYLLESTTNDYHNQRKPCNTMKVGGNLDSKGFGIATPLGSDLREDISVAVLQLQEEGYLQKLHKKWWFNKGECGHDGESQGSQSSPLTLSNVAGIFYILIGGLGLAMLFSIVEFFEKQRMESSRERASFAASLNSRSKDELKELSHDNGTYSQILPTQMIGFDSCTSANKHTQV